VPKDYNNETRSDIRFVSIRIVGGLHCRAHHNTSTYQHASAHCDTATNKYAIANEYTNRDSNGDGDPNAKTN
jgi:hypothetical protein